MAKKQLFYFTKEETGFGDFYCLFNHLSGKHYEMQAIEAMENYKGEKELYYVTDTYTINGFTNRKYILSKILEDTNSGFSCGSFDSFEQLVSEYPETEELKIFF